MAESAIILGIILLLASCSTGSKREDDEPVAAEEYVGTPLETPLADSTVSDMLPPNKEEGKVTTIEAIADSYDDGYLDGEAMAEEDRLAGRPGMQVGMDDDDEDYEDGYDDGYVE